MNRIIAIGMAMMFAGFGSHSIAAGLLDEMKGEMKGMAGEAKGMGKGMASDTKGAVKSTGDEMKDMMNDMMGGK